MVRLHKVRGPWNLCIDCLNIMIQKISHFVITADIPENYHIMRLTEVFVARNYTCHVFQKPNRMITVMYHRIMQYFPYPSSISKHSDQPKDRHCSAGLVCHSSLGMSAEVPKAGVLEVAEEEHSRVAHIAAVDSGTAEDTGSDRRLFECEAVMLVGFPCDRERGHIE